MNLTLYSGLVALPNRDDSTSSQHETVHPHAAERSVGDEDKTAHFMMMRMMECSELNVGE